MKKKLLYAAILLAAGFYMGRTTAPIKSQTKTVEVVKEKTKVVRKPDGTVIEVRERDTKNSEESKVTQSIERNWSIGVYKNIQTDVYTLTVDRLIFPNIYAGVYGQYNADDGDSQFGIGLRLNF
jgi:hypothetical protein